MDANSHPIRVQSVKGATFFANSHPYKVTIEGGGGQEARVVDELPEEGEVGYIYLVLKEETKEGDIYDEWIWALQQDGTTYGWEHIGATNEVKIEVDDEISAISQNPVQNRVIKTELDKKINITDYDTNYRSDYEENDSTSHKYIENRPFYSEQVENTLEQYGSTSAGPTSDTDYVWFIEKVEGYSLTDELAQFEDGDIILTTLTYSVNGVEKTDGAKFILSVDDGHYNLDSDMPAGNRWRGAYASEIDGDTTFRWPVLATDASATIYLTKALYEKVKQIDSKYIPADGGSDITLYQTYGQNIDGAMAQKATTDLVYTGGDPTKINIGDNSVTGGTNSIIIGSEDSGTITAASDQIVIGHNNTDSARETINIGHGNTVQGVGSIVIGRNAVAPSSDSVIIGDEARASSGGDTNICIGRRAGYNGTGNGNAIAIGYNTVSSYEGLAIGNTANSGGYNWTTAIGASSRATGNGSVAIGYRATIPNNAQGVVSINTSSTSAGYNSSNYRLLTGLYDAQEDHDAVTLGQLNSRIIAGGTTAPTASTVGQVGTLYVYVDTTGTTPTPSMQICTSIDDTDPSNIVYTWTDMLASVEQALQQINSGTGV